ncbi:MAG: glycosyltransferase family 2 protein [Clostridia bacterium]|nr:glycosyltransferase family 2 protein [Clostridia bacterium]
MITGTVVTINLIVGIVFFLLYAYQLIYFIIPFVKKEKPHKPTELHRFAIMISARNEENVIATLVNSIHHQDYPQELIDVYVIADNCTDETARVAGEAGAIVFVRNDMEKVGKGYALDYAINRIFKDCGEDYYDGFMVFDADNILDTNYITAMNRTFSDGHRIITSYRNSTNYGTNWITAGYALWYIRESKFLNHSRMLLGSGCAISGTGFLVHKDILKKNGGWKYYLLTEDIEFSIANSIEGEKIAYCKDAFLYDEQPQTFKQSWTQRLRWARGFLQVFGKYGSKLIKSMFVRNGGTCFDMSMTILPAIFMTLVIAVVNLVAVTIGLANGENCMPILISLGQWVCGVYLMLFLMGLITTIAENKHIHTSGWKKFKYLFTFPLFQFTYVPISVVAIFKNVEWEPTRHHGPSVSSEKIEQTKESTKVSEK